MLEGISIDLDTASRITLASLKLDYEDACSSIKNSKNSDDLKYDRRLKAALEVVLSYYMTKSEFEAFIAP